jgi:hypothetical protein
MTPEEMQLNAPVIAKVAGEEQLSRVRKAWAERNLHKEK